MASKTVVCGLLIASLGGPAVACGSGESAGGLALSAIPATSLVVGPAVAWGQINSADRQIAVIYVENIGAPVVTNLISSIKDPIGYVVDFFAGKALEKAGVLPDSSTNPVAQSAMSLLPRSVSLPVQILLLPNVAQSR